MKSTLLLCSLQRMHDGWSKDSKFISNFQPPIKAAPQQCLQKRISNSHGFVQQRVKTFRSAERLAKLSRLSPSSLTYVWATAKIDSWRSATIGWSVCLRSALLWTCNMLHDGWSKLNLNFTRSRESFATARSENRFWGEKLSPWSGQSAG